MSLQLTWRRTTATKTGTAAANFVNDIVSAVNAVSGDANYKWQVASSNSAGTPFYVVLKRKNGLPGRILIVHWSSSPSGLNPVLLETSPTTTHVYIAWHPAGNVDTPSNLTSSSGAVLGDDTGATRVVSIGVLSNIYGANMLPFVWDSEEAVWLTFQNPASAVFSGCGAGKIFVDKDDNEYDGVFGHGNGGSLDGLGSSSPPTPYTTSSTLAGSTTPHARANKGATVRPYFTAYARTGWATQPIASSVLYDGATSKAWFDAVLMIPNEKGVGPDLKLRQVAVGPPTVASFSVFNTASLTPAAISAQGNSGSNSGNPWFTNFKV